MFRKYLKEIGVNEEYWPETVYTSAKSEVRDFREKEYNKYYDKVGVNPAETWNLGIVALMWLYERLVEYRKHASKTIDLEFHIFKIDNKEYKNLPRQELPAFYQYNGAIYLIKAEELEKDNMFSEGCYAYIMPRERSIDIDTALDFMIAETIMKKVKK